MSGLNLMVELTGSRVRACRPPRGTSSQILATHLQRRVSQSRGSSVHGHTPTLRSSATRTSSCSADRGLSPFLLNRGAYRDYSTWKDFSSTDSMLSSEDVRFLSHLVQSPSPDRTVPLTNPQRQIDTFPAQPGTISGLFAASKSKGNPSTIDVDVHLIDPMDNLHQLFQDALKAMQLRNSRRLLVCLNKIAQMPENELVDSVAALPRTTFSEFLRCLDPYRIGRENDPTYGIPIGPGTWQFLNLGAVLDEWGIRTLYTKLLRQMLTLMRALKTLGQVLTVHDYVPLLRAAGLTSDPSVAKLLWEQMKEFDMAYWRTSNTYHEFIKSRFLTDPAYSGYDKTRLVMTPRNLHRRGRVNFIASVNRLDKLLKNLRKVSFRFGLDRNIAHAQDLSRMLRKPLPSTRMFFYTQMRGVRMSEVFLCTLMVAFARSGSLRFIQYRILEDYFGISVEKNNANGEIYVRRSATKVRPTKDPFRPSKPFVIPTAKLIDAVVYAYCSNGQLSMAFNVVDFISNTYKIPISQKTWFELLEWSYILSTPPISRAWHMVGHHDRVPSLNAIEIIWNTMTTAPYNAQPGFKEYDILIRSSLALGKTKEAITHMRHTRNFYTRQCIHLEAAAFEYASAKDVGVDFTRELQTFQRARFIKSYMLNRMRGWLRTLLEKKSTPTSQHDSMATSGIPDLVREWRDILPNPVRYRTASGYVSLIDPAEPFEQTMFVRTHVVDTFIRREGQWRRYPLRQTQFRLLSKHGVGDLMSARKHPLDIMKGLKLAGRPTQSRRLHKYRAWKAAQDRVRTEVVAGDSDPTAEPQETGSTELDQDIWDDDDY